MTPELVETLRRPQASWTAAEHAAVQEFRERAARIARHCAPRDFEDVAHDAVADFLRAARASRAEPLHFDTPEKLFAYLARLVHHAAARRHGEPPRLGGPAPRPDAADPTPAGLTWHSREALAEAVEALGRDLGPDVALLVRLRFLGPEPQSLDSLAADFGVTRSAVSGLILSGLTYLRLRLRRSFPDLDATLSDWGGLTDADPEGGPGGGSP